MWSARPISLKKWEAYRNTYGLAAGQVSGAYGDKAEAAREASGMHVECLLKASAGPETMGLCM